MRCVYVCYCATHLVFVSSVRRYMIPYVIVSVCVECSMQFTAREEYLSALSDTRQLLECCKSCAVNHVLHNQAHALTGLL